MNRSYRIAGNFGGCGVCASVAGVGVAAAMIGIMSTPPAHADDAPDPADLLSSSINDLTEAKDGLIQINPSMYIAEEFIGPQIQDLADFADLVKEYEGIQEPLLSSHDHFMGEAANLLFFIDDQQIEQASGAVLSTTQAFESLPSYQDMFSAIWADVQLLDASVFESLIPNRLVGFAEEIFHSGAVPGAVATDAGADLATGFLPGADLASGFLPGLPF